SNPGDHTHIPIDPGSTATMPPPTPLFAGSPTRNTKSPTASYVPQVSISALSRLLELLSSITSPLPGTTPSLAMNDTALAKSTQLISMAHCRQYASITTSTSFFRL